MDTTDPPDFTAMDDSALLGWRENSRAQLQRLPPLSPGHAALSALLDQSATELVERPHGVDQGELGDRWTR